MPNLQISPLRDWYVFGLFLVLIIALLAFAEVMFRRRLLPPQVSRKMVHLLTGALVLASPFLFVTVLPILVLAVLFIGVNGLALRRNFLPGIHPPERKSLGTVFYPVSFLLLAALLWDHDRFALLVGMSLMAVADVVAAIVGENVRSPRVLHLGGDRKTLQGSLAMFVSSLFLAGAGFVWWAPRITPPLSFPSLAGAVLAIALLATAAEAVSWRGSDNLTVPLIGAAASHFFVTASPAAMTQFLFGMALALLLAVISWRVHFLDSSGALATFVLGTLIFGLGGWAFALPILAFFVFSSLLSRFGLARKSEANERFQKGSRRDLGQVLANGGVPGLLALSDYFSSHPRWFVLYLGAVAAVTADTWATEIGLLSSRPPRMITTWERVTSGTSGAVSQLGLLGALLGASMIALTGWAVAPGGAGRNLAPAIVALIAVGGVLAHLCDSLLGATLQAQQACAVCHRRSEKKGRCCGVLRQPYSGWRWMDNDVVNGVCSLCGALLVLLGLHLV